MIQLKVQELLSEVDDLLQEAERVKRRIRWAETEKTPDSD